MRDDARAFLSSVSFLSSFFSAVFVLVGCSTPPSAPAANSVTIERTTYGVAHITAADVEALAYGVAYANAQDNVCQTAQQLVTVRGERSKFFGGAGTGLLGLRTLPNEQVDFFIAAHMDDAVLARAYAATSADASAEMRGYVAGYNRYLSDTGPAGLPAACRNAAWVRPMTIAELRRINELSMTQAGIAAYADAMLLARPPAPPRVGGAEIDSPRVGGAERDTPNIGAGDASVVTPAEAVAALASYRIGDLAEGGGIGSNGWAFGRDVTPDGSGVLLGNPHFPWLGTNRFWQLHLTIPGRMDVMGASIGQNAVVQIGFNKDLAWTHTVSAGKRFTLHELTLVPGDPLSYVVDGQPHKMGARIVAIESMNADGSIARKETTVWQTVWGPVIAIPRAGLGWTAKTAYAFKDANSGNARATDTWLRMNVATSVEELRAAMGHQGIPWVNTIAADRAGRVLYADLSVVPDIGADDLQRCAPSRPAAALFASAGLPVLDGSKSACRWRSDSASPVPGLIAPARMPVAIRSDWVQNSNDSFWLSNPQQTWTDISPLVGLQGTPQGLRTRMGIREIRRRLSGEDGMRGIKMGPADVQAILFGDRNLAARLVVDDLVAACGAATSADQQAGCRVLKGWDQSNTLEAAGAPLFREFWRKAREIPNVWRVPFNPADPVATPSGLNLADGAVRSAVFAALGDAVAALRAAGFAPDATLRTAQVKKTPRGPIAVPGGDEFEGVLNKVQTPGVNGIVAGGYDITYGSSYIQTVTFDSRGPVAQGMLTYGQSSDPASPYAYDQLEVFSRGQWPMLPFHRADIEARRVGAPLVLVVR